MKLLIARSVVVALRPWQQYPGDPEAGGILVGTFSQDHATVLRISTPGPKDERTPVMFKRHPGYHQEFLRQCHEWSGGKEGYVGEWHTHNRVDLKPTSPDYLALSMILYELTGRVPYLFCLIVGRCPAETADMLAERTGVPFPLYAGLLMPGVGEMQECAFEVVDG